MSRTVCPCGMPQIYIDGSGTPVEAWSVPWHEEHYRRHVDRYPDIDDQSKANLLAKVAWARVLEDGAP